ASLRDFGQHKSTKPCIDRGRNSLQDKLLARDHRFSREWLRLQDFIDKKKGREECTQMDRSVQVIDQLRANGGLSENKLNRGERIASVIFQHGEKREIAFGGLEIILSHRFRVSLG